MLAACAFPGGAGALDPAVNPRTQPMQFVLQRDGAAGDCGAACRPLVFASGMITADTPKRFEAFARENAIEGALIALDSDGGSVRGALALGRAIRDLGLATTVGRRSDRAPAAPGGAAPLPATCESMCAFVLLGGVRREVPDKSRVLVHQIWLGDRRDDAVAASYSAEDLVLVQRDIGHIVRYTADMGGGAELIEVALRIPPWEPMRPLSRDELRRARLDLSDETAQPAARPRGPAVGGDHAAQTNGRAWALREGRDGSAALLARSHPLTFEGDRIGSFDLALACGEASGSYTLTYAERRSANAAGLPPPVVQQVRMWIGDSHLAVRVRSSDAKGAGRQVETLAAASVAAPLLRAFAETGRPLAIETRSAGHPPTMIRIGNGGLAQSFAEFEALCGERASPRIDAHAHLEPRPR